MAKKSRDAMLKDEVVKKAEKAALVHKKWVEQKNMELMAKRAEEDRRKKAQMQKDEEVQSQTPWSCAL